MRGARLAVALIVALTLTACQGASDERPASRKSATPAAGVMPEIDDCFADEIIDASYGPDLTTKVPCSKKHLYEVIGVVDIPDRFLRGESRSELLRDRTRLGDLQMEDTYDALSPFSTFMAKVCSTASLKLAGLGDLQIGGRPGVDLLAEPTVSSAYMQWFMPSKTQWQDAGPTAFCAFRFDESHRFDYAEVDGVTAPTNEALARQVIDPSAPQESRFCFNYDKNYEADRTSCTKVHDAEGFLSYEVDAMTGSRRLGNRVYDEQDVTDKQYDILIEPCLDSMSPVLGPHDPNLYVDVLFDSLDWDVKGARRVQCVVTSDEESRLPGRSLIGDARKVEFVPRGDDA